LYQVGVGVHQEAGQGQGAPQRFGHLLDGLGRARLPYPCGDGLVLFL
jgi:hypothetical protein